MYNKVIIYILFLLLSINAQSQSDDCLGATQICPGVPVSGNAANATASLCGNCADGLNATGRDCFDYNKTQWLSFTTNGVGGSVAIFIDTNNCAGGDFDAIIYEATTPCDFTTYTPVSNCIRDYNTNLLTANGLMPRTTYYIQINSDSVNGCDYTLNMSGRAVEFDISLSPNDSIFIGDTIQLQSFANELPIRYEWDPANFVNNPNIANPIARPAQTTIFKLTAYDSANCPHERFVTITVFNEIGIPNTFTPNGDGVNDTWEIANIENFPRASIRVYNRWGQEVFNTIGYTPDRQWDGTNNGKKLPTSTYFYVIDLSVNTDLGDGEIYTGTITIIN